MSFSIGIVGLPNVGKSSLFKLLTKKQVDAENYPFCTIEPNVGIVEVPDERLQKLAKVSQSKKIIPTTIEFVDIAGLVKGAHKGEGLGNQFLQNIKETDAIIQVVRHFKDDNVIHVHGNINPEEDIQTINLELILADLNLAQKIQNNLEKQLKGKKDKILEKKYEIIQKIVQTLENEVLLNELNLNDKEKQLIKEYNFLTIKPFLYVYNTDEEGLKKDINIPNINNEYIIKLSAKIESELIDLPENEQKELLEYLNIKESGLDQLIKKSYSLLNLITYFTSGETETRAWTITKGTKAPQAAGKIHSDFEKGFIRAEVINWVDFVNLGGEVPAKEAGMVRLEGKDYIVQDGDVMHFRFNK